MNIYKVVQQYNLFCLRGALAMCHWQWSKIPFPSTKSTCNGKIYCFRSYLAALNGLFWMRVIFSSGGLLHSVRTRSWALERAWYLRYKWWAMNALRKCHSRSTTVQIMSSPIRFVKGHSRACAISHLGLQSIFDLFMLCLTGFHYRAYLLEFNYSKWVTKYALNGCPIFKGCRSSSVRDHC